MMQIYPHWDTKLPEIPARSRLYNLKPVGVGTADVESLTGYIARLAHEHCLVPSTLLSKVLTAFGGDSCRASGRGIHPQQARVLNGTGSNPRAFTEALEFLTACHDLRYITMVTYADVLSRQHLLRPKRAWCPACFDGCAQAGNTVYESLLWSIAAVTVCLHHQLPLAEVCPHCGCKQAPLSSFSRPGYCAKCQAWLGISQDALAGRHSIIPEAKLSNQVWITETVGEVLAAAPHLPAPPVRKQFIERLELCIDQAAWGNINAFSAQVGMWHVSIRRMLKGEVLPTMSMLLQMCSQLKLPLVALLAGTKEIVLPGADSVLESLSQHRTKQQALPRTERMDFIEVEKEMMAAVEEYPPPSVSELNRRTGRKLETLQRRYPDLYAQILNRYRDFHRPDDIPDEEAEATLKTALKQNPPPSLQSIFRQLGCRSTGYRYYARFPKLCRAIAARYQERRNKHFDVEEVRRFLEAMLAEDPAPSFSEAARRLNHGRLFIRTKFPELTAAITARHQVWLSTYREESKKTLIQEVEKAIRDLMAEGLYASEARIKGRLSRHWHGTTFKQTIQEVKEKLGLLK